MEISNYTKKLINKIKNSSTKKSETKFYIKETSKSIANELGLDFIRMAKDYKFDNPDMFVDKSYNKLFNSAKEDVKTFFKGLGVDINTKYMNSERLLFVKRRKQGKDLVGNNKDSGHKAVLGQFELGHIILNHDLFLAEKEDKQYGALAHELIHMATRHNTVIDVKKTSSNNISLTRTPNVGFIEDKGDILSTMWITETITEIIARILKYNRYKDAHGTAYIQYILFLDMLVSHISENSELEYDEIFKIMFKSIAQNNNDFLKILLDVFGKDIVIKLSEFEGDIDIYMFMKRYGLDGEKFKQKIENLKKGGTISLSKNFGSLIKNYKLTQFKKD